MVDRLEQANGTNTVVKDLVASFLLPEVERRAVQLRGAVNALNEVLLTELGCADVILQLNLKSANMLMLLARPF